MQLIPWVCEIRGVIQTHSVGYERAHVGKANNRVALDGYIQRGGMPPTSS